jgi:hypothetical protein
LANGIHEDSIAIAGQGISDIYLLHGSQQSKASKPPFTGVFSGIAYTVKTNGFFALYDGLGVTLLFSIPKAGIRFGGHLNFISLWPSFLLQEILGVKIFFVVKTENSQ